MPVGAVVLSRILGAISEIESLSKVALIGIVAMGSAPLVVTKGLEAGLTDRMAIVPARRMPQRKDSNAVYQRQPLSLGGYFKGLKQASRAIPPLDRLMAELELRVVLFTRPFRLKGKLLRGDVLIVKCALKRPGGIPI